MKRANIEFASGTAEPQLHLSEKSATWPANPVSNQTKLNSLQRELANQSIAKKQSICNFTKRQLGFLLFILWL